METRQRTVVKALLWQVLGLGVMLGVGVLATGSVALGGTIALANTAVGFLTYIVYERLWSRVSWGRA
ncbi:MAG: DUF2061 domain-containing protein [Paracoccaceae bacterium]